MTDSRSDKTGAGEICLRPHHLLCLMGFQGKGYSAAFVKRMTEVSALLKRHQDTSVYLRSGVDDLCAACPHSTDEGICDHDDQVRGYDERTLSFLHLCEGTAAFDEWMRQVRESLTADVRTAICGDCAWTEECLLVQSITQEKTYGH